jgi:carbonic anhydrase/acetyltransferase-like protein (isoleucine patch superfamily)
VILAFEGRRPDLARAAFVAPDATVIGDVALGEDASLWYHATLRGDLNWIRIGRRSNIQDGCVIHVDRGRWPVRVGDEVTVGHRVILHGCTVEDLALVGMGAVLLNDVVVGEGSLVAAGAVVLEGVHIPPRSLAAGVPAKVIRQLADADLAHFRASADRYVELARAHRALEEEGRSRPEP